MNQLLSLLSPRKYSSIQSLKDGAERQRKNLSLEVSEPWDEKLEHNLIHLFPTTGNKE